MSRALVISGGGSKGAFAVGVLKRLFEVHPGLKFDILVGTSTGALMIPMVAMNDMNALERLYTTQTNGSIVVEGRLGDRINDVSIFDASPLKRQLQQNYTRETYESILAGGKQLLFTTACLQTGKLEVFTTGTLYEPENYELTQIQSDEHFRQAILASACQPVFMQPVSVNASIAGSPRQKYQYVDGGVREYAGVQMAIDCGATEIFTILMSPGTEPADDIPPLTDLFSILRKTIDIFTDDVGKNDLIIPQNYNRALEYIAAVKAKMHAAGIPQQTVDEYFDIAGMESPYQGKQPIKFYTFRPDATLNGGPGGLSFDPAVMRDMIGLGIGITNRFLAGINDGEINWG